MKARWEQKLLDSSVFDADPGQVDGEDPDTCGHVCTAFDTVVWISMAVKHIFLPATSSPLHCCLKTMARLMRVQQAEGYW